MSMNLFSRDRIRFDRNELAGSFGDIGTDLPLIVGIILAAGLDSGSVFIIFGLLQIITGVIYGIPMPMQPLKAMPFWSLLKKLRARFMGRRYCSRCHHASADHHRRINILCQMDSSIRRARYSIRTGDCHWPLLPSRTTFRQWVGGVRAGICRLCVDARTVGKPADSSGTVCDGIGVIYAFAAGLRFDTIGEGVGLHLPQMQFPSLDNSLTGAVLLALPQIPCRYPIR